MLTKGDLNQIKNVVKYQLRGFVTKDDLKDFATKDDLKGFATKGDLKDFATRDDIDGITKELRPMKSDIAKLRKDVDVMLSMFDREYVDLRKEWKE